MSNRTFKLPANRGYVIFDDAVLQHMYSYAQTRLRDREAGGQLFSPAPHISEVLISPPFTRDHIEQMRPGVY
jgi:hypothetical protein